MKRNRKSSFKERYILKETLGKGTFSSVMLAFDTWTGKEVAIKFIPIPNQSFELKYVIGELTHNWKLRGSHPHVVQFFDAYLTDRNLAITMEYVKGTTLRDKMDALGRYCTEDEARTFFQPLIAAVQFCHERGVAIRDVKMENLMIEKDTLMLKLIDFGLSKADGEVIDDTEVGTLRYMAPEAFDVSQYDAKAGDIWACGVLLFALTMGSFPFDVPRTCLSKTIEIRKKIQNLEIRYPSHKVSESLLDLLTRMFHPDPTRRISLSEIKKHPWYIQRSYSIPKTSFLNLERRDSTYNLKSIEDVEDLAHKIEIAALDLKEDTSCFHRIKRQRTETDYSLFLFEADAYLLSLISKLLVELSPTHIADAIRFYLQSL